MLLPSKPTTLPLFSTNAAFCKMVVEDVASAGFGASLNSIITQSIISLLGIEDTFSVPSFIISQYFTISWLAFSHGTNDSQKGMGLIGMLLLANHTYDEFTVPTWVIILCASSITLGTMFGGWNIIKTVGFGIYKVKLIHSIVNQISAASVILSSSIIGAPTSTTQVVTTSLMGVGAGERPKHVRWEVVKTIFKGWLYNIPTSFVLGVVFYILIFHLLK